MGARKLLISGMKAVIKADPIDITKTIIRHYYEIFAYEIEKVEKMDKFIAKLNLKNKRKK